MTAHKCVDHVDYHLNLQHFGNTNLKYLEVTGSCRECRKRLQFRGPMGLNPAHPTVAPGGGEAIFPFLIEGEVYDGKAIGYGIDLGRPS